MLGDAVEITEGYRTWWSYIPHFIGTPGYVYAYAYGQLLALSVYRRYEEQGADFVPRYLDLLRGRRLDGRPRSSGAIVGCRPRRPRRSGTAGSTSSSSSSSKPKTQRRRRAGWPSVRP